MAAVELELENFGVGCWGNFGGASDCDCTVVTGKVLNDAGGTAVITVVAAVLDVPTADRTINEFDEVIDEGGGVVSTTVAKEGFGLIVDCCSSGFVDSCFAPAALVNVTATLLLVTTDAVVLLVVDTVDPTSVIGVTEGDDKLVAETPIVLDPAKDTALIHRPGAGVVTSTAADTETTDSFWVEMLSPPLGPLLPPPPPSLLLFTFNTKLLISCILGMD